MNQQVPSGKDFPLLKLKTQKKIEESTVNCCSRLKVRYISATKKFPVKNFLGLEQYISGVILYEETLYQKTDEGTQFVDILKSKGIIPGIKVTFYLFCHSIIINICLTKFLG